MRRLLLTFLLSLLPAVAPAVELSVGAGRTYATIRSALAAARDGDTITVHGGVYHEGNLVIDKSVALFGRDRPRLDGDGLCEVLTITAPRVTIRGFDLEHGGTSSLTDVAGIKVVAGAHRVTLEDNLIRDCSFGIYFSKANDGVIRRNKIHGAPGRAEENGNGIHAWSCERLEIAHNEVSGHRDGIYLEFTTDAGITGNRVTDNNRYGLHFMFSHRNAYRGNRFLHNGAGVAVMYSREVRMEANHFGRSWGSSAYGLLLKDMSDSSISDNTFELNSTAICMQNSTRMTLERNLFRGNGWALQVASSSTDNVFAGNTFVGNSFDLATNGQLELNRFDGNYWDKAETYDLNRDGIGDVPYRPVSLFAMLVERMPASLLLLRSPLVHFLDRAERIFPSLIPISLIDARPAMRPHVL